MIGRVLLLAALAVVIPVAVLSVLSMKISEEELGAHADSRASEGARQVRSRLELLSADLDREGRRLAEDERLVFGITHRLGAAVADVAEGLRDETRSEYVGIYDASLTPIALAGDGSPVVAEDPVRRSIGAGYEARDGEVHLCGYWKIAVPDDEGEGGEEAEPAGYLVCGRRLDPKILTELGRGAGTEALLFHGSERLDGTIEGSIELSEDMLVAFDGFRENDRPDARAFLVSIDGELHSLAGSRLPKARLDGTPVYVATAVSRRPIAEATGRIERATIATAIAGVALFAVAAVGGFRRSISRPLEGVRDDLVALAAGPLAVHGLDGRGDSVPELRALGDPMERLRAGIREWRLRAAQADLLEAVLAGIPEDPDPGRRDALLRSLATLAASRRRGVRDFDLHESIERALDALAFSIPAGERVERRYQCVVLVAADEAATRQALLSLLAGAIRTIDPDATGDGIAIATERTGRTVRLELRAPGPVEDEAFDRPIVEALLAGSGGTLEVRPGSTETTFVVLLPAAQAARAT